MESVRKRKVNNRIKEGSPVATAIIYSIVIVICFATLYPFFYVFIQSIADPQEVIDQTVFFWPKKLYFGSYGMLFRDAAMWRAYLNTFLYVAAGAFLNVAFAVLGAYPLAVRQLKFRPLVVKFLLIPMYFSGGLIPTFILVSRLHMYDTIWAMIIPGAVGIYNIILIRAFFVGLPGEMRESAHIDGAGHLRILFRIYVPLSTPVMAVVAIYSIVNVWNSWFNALIYLPNPKLHPVQFYLYRVMIQQTVRVEDLMSGGMDNLVENIRSILANYQFKYALIIFTTLPIIFAYPYFQRFFIKGIMVGSLKA